jgi:hypothetical protein
MVAAPLQGEVMPWRCVCCAVLQEGPVGSDVGAYLPKSYSEPVRGAYHGHGGFGEASGFGGYGGGSGYYPSASEEQARAAWVCGRLSIRALLGVFQLAQGGT